MINCYMNYFYNDGDRNLGYERYYLVWVGRVGLEVRIW